MLTEENRIRVASVTLIGGRRNQQDALDYRFLPRRQFAAVFCDGMGGLNGGALAAQTGCRRFFEEYQLSVPGAGGAVDLAQIARRLDRQVEALTDTDGLPLDGGSTILAVILRAPVFDWLSVGDSRMGLLREGHMFWLNRLHNYRLELDEALKNGDISRDEYEAETPRGSALLSYLGCGGLKYIDSQSGILFQSGDMLLLCSDGFHTLVPEEKLIPLMGGLNENMTNLPELLAPFLGPVGKGMDNASAIVIRYQ